MSVQEILNIIRAFFDALVSIVNTIRGIKPETTEGQSTN